MHGRGGPRHRGGTHPALRGGGGLRRPDQPDDRRRPGRGRDRAGRRGGAPGGGRVRAGRRATERNLPRLPDPEHRRGAARLGGASRHALDGPRAGHQGGRRGRHDRRDGCGRERGRRRAVALRPDPSVDAGPPGRADEVIEPTPYRPITYLEWNAGRLGSRVAVWEGGREISFEELLFRVRGIQAKLAARGVREGDVVGVRLPNIWQYVALELAIPDLGAVILPLPLGLGEHEMHWVIEKTQPRLVVTDADLDWLSSEETKALLPRRVPHQDPAGIVEIALTSGTTGMPKLASLSARLKQVTFESFTERLQITEEDRVLPMTPLTQGIGGMCLFCLRRGAALVMLREPHWTAEHCLAVAAESGATLVVGVPTNVIRMLNHSLPSLNPLRAVAVAGAPLPPEIAERWETTTGVPISSSSGSMAAGQLAVASPSDPQGLRWTTVGRPHDRAEWQIVEGDRKSTRLNSSHLRISYAVFCLKTVHAGHWRSEQCRGTSEIDATHQARDGTENRHPQRHTPQILACNDRWKACGAHSHLHCVSGGRSAG